MERVKVGFVGLGVMGAPMSRHLDQKLAKTGAGDVVIYDASPAVRASAVADGLTTVDTLQELAANADQIHLCLPGGPQLDAVCRGRNVSSHDPVEETGAKETDADETVASEIGSSNRVSVSMGAALLDLCGPNHTIIDHGTSPVGLTRDLAKLFAAKGASYCDAPITRTRAAAETGTLVVLFGGTPSVLERVRPAISCFAEEIFHCGDVGAGQVVKQMNNMVLIQTVVALSEALATARAAGVDGRVLFDALSAGSGDSFALRNHGMKAILPGEFPERAFAATYAKKDLDYARELAQSHGLELRQADVANAILERAIAAGAGAKYWPVVAETIAAAWRSGDETA